MSTFGWNLVAQGLMSLGQLVVGTAGALLLAPDSWGELAVVLAVHHTVVATVRGATQPVLTWFAGDEESVHPLRRPGTALQLALAAPGATVVGLVAGLLLSPGAAVGAVAATVTAALWDANRTMELAAHHPRRAALADAAYLATVSLAVPVVAALDTGRPIALTTALAVAAAAAAALLLLTSRGGQPSTLAAYVRTLGRDVPWMCLDGLLVTAASTSLVVVAAAAAGDAAAGVLRTSTTLFAGPVQMLLVATTPSLLRILREQAAVAAAAPATDRRLRSLRHPLALTVGAVGTAATVGAVSAGVGAPLAAAWGLAPIEEPARIALAPTVLAGVLWSASMTGASMRYRRRWPELLAVRALTSALAVGALVVALEHGAALGTAVLWAAVPWAVLPLAHAGLRWRPVHPDVTGR